MSGILFDPESAKRIANATRGWEREQGAEPPIGYQPNDYGRLMMVQTGTLPSGYTGAMAVHGNVVEKTPAGLIRVIAPIWIKDLNGSALAANTIYYGRIGGSFTQDYTVNGTTTPTTLGLYLVQVGASLPTGGVWLRPWRWAWLAYTPKDNPTVYARAVVWAEKDPDSYDVPVFSEGQIFNFEGTGTAANDARLNGENTFLFFVQKIDEKPSNTLTSYDLEPTPSVIWNEMLQGYLYVKNTEIEPIENVIRTASSVGSAYPFRYPFKFTRKYYKNGDGSASVVSVSTFARNLFVDFKPYRSFNWYALDSNGNQATTYPANQSSRFGVGKKINFTNLAGGTSVLKLMAGDPFGVGYLLDSSHAYLMTPGYNLNYWGGPNIVPTQVYHYNSPLAPAGTIAPVTG